MEVINKLEGQLDIYEGIKSPSGCQNGAESSTRQMHPDWLLGIKIPQDVEIGGTIVPKRILIDLTWHDLPY